MLSSAHVLAMDAKNLLDVVDSLRVRFPDLFAGPKNVIPAAQPQAIIENQHQLQTTSPQSTHSQYTGDDCYQIMTRQTYQNLSQMQQHQQQSNESHDQYSNEQCGIYDNESAITQQMEHMDLESKHSTGNGPPSKPPVAAKPSNLQQKLRRQQLQQQQLGAKDSSIDTNAMDDTLRIVEDDQYQEEQLYSNTSAAGMLPVAVSCAVVQENVFQKAMSNKSA